MKKKSLLIIFTAIFLGIVIGNLTGTDSKILGVTYYSIYNFFSTLFLNALMLMVVPLILSSIISAISGLTKEKSFKKIGLETVITFVGINFLAILTGLILINLFKNGFNHAAESMTSMKTDLITSSSQVSSVADVIINIIPKNIFFALTNGQMLGIIFFSLLFGFALTTVDNKYHETLNNFWKGIFECMLKMTNIIMIFLPLGVFSLVAREFAQTGFQTLKSLGFFIILILSGFLIHCCGTLFLLLRFVAKTNPFKYTKEMLQALITAFSTSSSSATMPLTLNCLEKNIKLPSKITNFAVPLGTSLNLSASALYVIVSSAFIAKYYGIELTIPVQMTIFLLSFLTTFGMAAIPSGCLVTTILVLKSLGVPADGIGIIIAADRLLDMFRTVANVFSVSVSTAVITKLENKKTVILK